MKLYYGVEFVSNPFAPDSSSNFLVSSEFRELNDVLPKFSDDCTELGRKLPNLPSSVHFKTGVIDIEPGSLLVGHKWLLGKNKKFFSDRVYHSYECSSLFNGDKDVPINFDDSTGFIYQSTGKVLEINKKIGVAVSTEPSNWGSFIFRVLPKLVVLKLMGYDDILFYCRHETQLQAALALGFKPEHIIIHKPNVEYVFNNGGAFCLTLEQGGYLSLQARMALALVPRQVDSRFGKRLYISRLNSDKRSCVNELEIIEMLKKYDFKIINPATLSFQEQVNAFYNADFVIGPSGAGMFNVAFCKPKTKVIDIESQRHWTFAHCSLFSSLDLNYGVFWGEPIDGKTGHAPFIVNVNSLEERVKSFIDIEC